MKHPDFCILGGVTQIGKVTVSDEVETACTNGVDATYGAAFIEPMTRKQLRYLVGHENLHKALHHCTEYIPIAKKHPGEFAQAVDYVVNWQLESMDTAPDKFLERPTSIPPLIDAAYADMSVPEVLRELLKKGNNSSKQAGKTMDVHVLVEKTPGNEEELDDVKQKIEDAVRHGEIVQGQLRANMSGPAVALNGFREQKTDWRPALRRIFQEFCDGDGQSRFNPPNKRMLPLDIIMPSHFDEMTGEIIIAGDTSGSMVGHYPLIFGEVARICQQLNPKSVRVLWWDTRIAGEQVFTQKDYPNLARAMAPKGGGGTTVSCVAAYIREKQFKPKAVIFLTDGYIESGYEVPAGNVVWGVVGNRSFQPIRGKVLHIDSNA
jgi:predicted metal-dependent peptidase